MTTPKRWAILKAISEAPPFTRTAAEIGFSHAPAHIRSRRQWANDAMFSLECEDKYVTSKRDGGRVSWGVTALGAAALREYELESKT
jgi:hypothetical protein